MKVLLSIKPEYADKILSGDKRFEFRKRIWAQNVDSIIVYSSMPVGKIVGEFSIKHIHEDSPERIWDQTKEYAGISEGPFMDYFFNKQKAFAIEIGAVTNYQNPIDPYKEYPGFKPPQSFMYWK